MGVARLFSVVDFHQIGAHAAAMSSRLPSFLHLLLATALLQLLRGVQGDDQVLVHDAPRNGSILANDDSEVASEAEVPPREKEERLFAKSSEVVAHSAEQVDKLIIETQEHAGATDLLPAASLAAIGAFVLVCTVVMGVWLLKLRRKREPATPQTPTEVTPDTEQRECSTPPSGANGVVFRLERPQNVSPVAASKPTTRSSSYKVTINRSDSMESCSGRSSSSAWTSMFHRMTSDPRERNSGKQSDEPYGPMVEVMTPRQSTGDNALQSSSGSGSGHWRSVLVTRLLHLKPLKYRTRSVTAPAHCYV